MKKEKKKKLTGKQKKTHNSFSLTNSPIRVKISVFSLVLSVCFRSPQ